MAKPTDVALVSLDGDTFRLAGEQGHPVALVCMKTVPDNDAAALAAQTAHEAMPGHAVWGIACGDAETAEGFVERLELGYPMLLDPGCGLVKSLGVEACPAAVFVNPAGRVVKVEEVITEETMREGMRAASEPTESVDPVCKMRVTKDSAAATYEYEGRTYYFCSPACMETFADDPGRFLSE